MSRRESLVTPVTSVPSASLTLATMQFTEPNGRHR
jgi:hypothetical protein